MLDITKSTKNRAFCAVVLLLILLLNGCSNGSNEQSIQIDKISFESKLIGKEFNLYVYVPQGYKESNKYPVLYFIGDYGGTADTVMYQYGIAERAEEMIANGEIEPLIIVGMTCDRSFGINSANQTESFETSSGKSFSLGKYSDYICHEVIPYIDNNYSTTASKDGRYIGGYSMGGFAALHNAFIYPELFSKVGGHSPSLFIEEFPDTTVSDWLYPNIEARKERDPIYLAREKDLSGLSIFLDVEIGGSSGVKYLHDILEKQCVNTVFQELSLSHSRSSCYENMAQYLLFYSGVDVTE